MKVIQMGLGPIGQAVVNSGVKRGLEFVGAIDPHPDKAGRDLGELCGTNKLGIKVEKEVDQLCSRYPGAVVIQTTTSSARAAFDQIKPVLQNGCSVVTTCEELALPGVTDPRLEKRINELAKRYNVSVIPAGINPGFLMDALPACLSTVCGRIDRLKVVRVLDARERRVPFQQKVGIGLTTDEFELNKNRYRHMGLVESVHALADTMGWKLDIVEEIIEPLTADQEITGCFTSVKKGDVKGLRQKAFGYINDSIVIEMLMEMYAGAENPRDSVIIKGDNPIESTIKGGVQGDRGTVNVVLNTLPLAAKETGFKLMTDLQGLSYKKLD